MNEKEGKALFDLAHRNDVVLTDDIKTAYLTAFLRLVLLAKSGAIGDIVSIHVTCTSLAPDTDPTVDSESRWNSICGWGPVAMLPVFRLLGTSYSRKCIQSLLDEAGNDRFTKIDLVYPRAVATIEVGKGVKSEGDLIVSGTKGYIYVPAPWWKTNYFETRFENQSDNSKHYYQLDGEGIRYELRNFLYSVRKTVSFRIVEEPISLAFCSLIGDFYSREDFLELK